MCKIFFTTPDITVINIVFTMFIVISLIALVIYVILNSIAKRVYQNSKLVHKVNEINKKYVFFNYNEGFKYKKYFHDVRKYRNFNAAVYLAEILLSASDAFLDVIKKTNESKVLYEQYLKEYSAIQSTATQEDAENVKMSLKRYKGIERNYYNSQKKPKPNTRMKFVIYCYLENTQRKGSYKVAFTYEDAVQIFYSCYKQTIDRQYDELNREIYAERVKAERTLLTDSLRYDILRRDGFRCQICGATAQDGAKLHVDHIIPVSKGGKTIPSNLRTLCDRCNLGKRDKIE